MQETDWALEICSIVDKKSSEVDDIYIINFENQFIVKRFIIISCLYIFLIKYIYRQGGCKGHGWRW